MHHRAGIEKLFLHPLFGLRVLTTPKGGDKWGRIGLEEILIIKVSIWRRGPWVRESKICQKSCSKGDDEEREGEWHAHAAAISYRHCQMLPPLFSKGKHKNRTDSNWKVFCSTGRTEDASISSASLRGKGERGMLFLAHHWLPLPPSWKRLHTSFDLRVVRGSFSWRSEIPD